MTSPFANSNRNPKIAWITAITGIVFLEAISWQSPNTAFAAEDCRKTAKSAAISCLEAHGGDESICRGPMCGALADCMESNSPGSFDRAYNTCWNATK